MTDQDSTPSADNVYMVLFIWGACFEISSVLFSVRRDGPYPDPDTANHNPTDRK